MSFTVLFQQTFTFIYSTFNDKFLVLVKCDIQTDPKFKNREDIRHVWLKINKKKKLKMRGNICLVRKNNNNK